ncbi:heat shock 70 kDa protein 12A-like isoform X1 [Lytechinus pictus]|uniref:heat shock 70 kDa protein 12A-like isoform X1 n=1 Tax=Lytechinus pictus TaxID=7653 RepID=UPI00240E5382|nr:heat shock 70 kDa protein 12A-like isoform X1 [Lytechinus pictus]
MACLKCSKDSPLIHANDLITSTPIKTSVTVDDRLCKNNSALANSEPSSPESMNLDAAIAINSIQATPEPVSPITESRPFWVVVAIDFGTTFSGYAYSLTREPESVHIMRKWEGGDPGVTNMKTPTTLLLTPEGEFHSFGFTARDFYHDMDHKEAMRWMYFDKFKLTLHGNPNLNLKTEIKAANGKSFPAATVFEHSLRFFHDHAIDELCDQSMDGEVDPRDIRWVLTVPAIWKQPAKQFMRQAAYKAGLASPSRPDQLLIALEPEAASIYIRKLRLRELAPEHQSQRQKWLRSSTGKITKSNSQVSESIRHGTRYMVVDCGGGTVDITVHEVEEGLGTLKELHKAAGGRYGSVSIDQEFEQLLTDIFGQDFIEEFKVKRPAGWVDLMIAFEARKRNASPWKNNPLNVSLPFSFIDYYKKYTNGKQMEDAVRKYNFKDVTWSAQVPGMLRFTPEGMQRLFASTVDRLITGVEEVLSSPSLTGISYLFVVGGFAQSALLQSAIRKKFSSQLRIIIPRDLGLSILKGAVLFGLDPSAVRVRRSRLTYGVGVLNKFQAGKHPDDKKVTKDNVDWCKDIFDTFVQADESVAVGDKVTRSYTPAKPSQQAIIINIYCSDRENVRFITDEGVRKCGTLHIDVSDSQYSGMKGRRELQLTMQYGDTEIKVSALDVPTGKCVKSSIDFLNK